MVAITHPTQIRFAGPTRVAPAVYRRRRQAVVGLALVLTSLATTGAQLVRGADDAGSSTRPVARVSVVVEPGDSVWSIAAELATGEDPRPVVDAIVAANGGSSLIAGQRLEVVVP